MNSKIESIINATVGLSSFEVNSVLGALRYNLLFRALTKTIALLPDLPEEGSGNEPHAQFEKNMRNPEITRAAAPLIGMADRIQEALEEYGTQPPSTFETVLGFALERVPSRAQLTRVRNQEDKGTRTCRGCPAFCRRPDASGRVPACSTAGQGRSGGHDAEQNRRHR